MALTPVHIARNCVVARLLHHIELDLADTDILAGHQAPGQFLQIAVGASKPGFYAIANAPWGAAPGRLELLVKAAGETSSALCHGWPGARVMASRVMGRGFRLERAEGRPLLIFCVGSGIAPVRAVIEGGLDAGAQPTWLYYGAFDRASMAYRDRFDAWRGVGVQVRTALDQEPADSDYEGFRGRVQDLFRASPPEIDVDQCAVLIVGMAAMVNEVTELVKSMGVPAERVLLNY